MLPYKTKMDDEESPLGSSSTSGAVDPSVEKDSSVDNAPYLTEDEDDPFADPLVDPPADPPADPPSISTISTRIKKYPENSKGPWVVYFRPKKKPLNVLQISKDLTKRFSAVRDIEKIPPNRLRVVVTNRKQANEIVAHQLFTLEYNVYIPARDVEIEGVVNDESLTKDDLLAGSGQFRNRALPQVKIVDCRQLGNSSTFRVTFEGSALPHYVVIGNLRLPVRLFVPRVMNCLNCNQLGHTADYCSNKRCSACGENHKDASCKAAESKCVHCGGDPHELLSCPEYIRRRDKTKRSLQAQSKRSFSEMVKSLLPPIQPQNNPYSLLSVDEEETNNAVAGTPFVFTGRSKVAGSKRKAPNSPDVTRKVFAGASSDAADEPAIRTANQNVPPGFRGQEFNNHFPVLPGTSKSPSVPLVQSVLSGTHKSPSVPLLQSVLPGTSKSSNVPITQSGQTGKVGRATLSGQAGQSKQSGQPGQSGQSGQLGQPNQPGLFKFSDIVNSLFDMFNFSDPVKSIITMMLPSVKTFLQKLMQQWPFLTMIVSLDG